jgi:hypothetical protein
MDRVRASEARDAGSIPAGSTYKKILRLLWPEDGAWVADPRFTGRIPAGQ